MAANEHCVYEINQVLDRTIEILVHTEIEEHWVTLTGDPRAIELLGLILTDYVVPEDEQVGYSE